MFDWNLGVGEIIQFIVVIIMAFSTYLSYRLIKINVDNNKLDFFIRLCKEEIEIRKSAEEYLEKSNKEKRRRLKEDYLKKADKIKFDFYESLSILLGKSNFYEDIFLDFFGNHIFGEVYVDFMLSPLFNEWKDKTFYYPNLSILFNDFDLSIKEVPKEWDE
ncbi:MAG: hypothetical protein Q7S33_00915 [Nanoarchaeota archaeon]|nr:hypothetical protein [Nanoarchaeota archaeon]